jgi:hypothetical protein
MPTATPAPTPKAVIHQRYGAKAVYRVEEVREPVHGACPGLALPQTTRCVYRGHLDLAGVLTVSTPGTFLRKKDAEQAAAQMAIDKVFITTALGSSRRACVRFWLLLPMFTGLGFEISYPWR